MKKLLLFLLVLLVACNPQEDTSNQEQPNQNETPLEDMPNEVAIRFADYFMPNDTIAYFEGYGNEFASYSLRTKWINDHYVATILDNGGATVQRIYRVSNQAAELVYEEVMDMPPENSNYLSIEELDKLTSKELYLQGPFEVGASFGKWKIAEKDATLSTPYKEFQNVLIFEEVGEDFMNRHYFVKGYGEVKRETIMNVDDTNNNPEQFTVTSTLKSIEYK